MIISSILLAFAFRSLFHFILNIIFNYWFACSLLVMGSIPASALFFLKIHIFFMFVYLFIFIIIYYLYSFSLPFFLLFLSSLFCYLLCIQIRAATGGPQPGCPSTPHQQPHHQPLQDDHHQGDLRCSVSGPSYQGGRQVTCKGIHPSPRFIAPSSPHLFLSLSVSFFLYLAISVSLSLCA